MDKHERTPYETEPVESTFDAVNAFTDAFDALQTVLFEFNESEEFSDFADALRSALYRPVRPYGDDIPTISLYEIGVVYFPDAGKYGINKRKLKSALRSREADIKALFVQDDGILPYLCEMLSDFLNPPVSEDEDENEGQTDFELNEFVQAAALRFLNECRRLTAMF